MEDAAPVVKKRGRPRMDSGNGMTSQITPIKKRKRITKTHPSRRDSLTIKQQKFIEVFLETNNATEAYRRAYHPVSVNENTLNRKAFDILHSDKVSARIREVEDKATQAMVYGLQEHLAELEEIRSLGIRKGSRNLGAAAKCVELKGKVKKLYTEQIELTGANGGPIQLQPVPALDLSIYTTEEIEQLYYLLGKQPQALK